ncbi:MAG: transglycosylase domain-containing protein, partial [Chloroflexota bacterium]|nr:transglycosylase domain-containing protein [Chloroflexota bacterium]
LHGINGAGRRGRERGRQRGVLAAGGIFGILGSLSTSTLVFALLGVALSFGTAVSAYAYFSRGLPDVNQFEARPFGTTRIYDRNGRLLHEISDPELGWRTNVTLEQVSPYVGAATIASEDPSFRTNAGVDPVGILRAAVINYNGEGRAGGSTITQQLVRALYPQSIGNAPSLTRKAREAIVSVRFARAYPKDKVLNLYLNEIYYGNRSYGIDAAAQSYFNKRAKDLDLAEASMLAGLPQAPSYFDPRYNFEGAKLRQRYVLEQMIKNGAVDRARAEAAYAQPLLPLTRDGRHNDAPHFVNYVRDHIEQKYGAERLFRGDLQVYTTLDYESQRTGERIVRDHVRSLRARNATNGALVAMLPATGEILAMVGSADYYDDSIDGQVNVTTRERQPGSSIKPIAYAAAFEKGWSPATKVMDVKAVYPVTTRAYAELEALRAQGRDPSPERERDTGSFYLPDNHDYLYHGAVTVRESLARSLNIPAIKAIQYAEIDRVIDLSHRMGIRSGLWRGANYYGFTLALGGGEVQPLEITNAYATFANGGKHVPLTPILKIVDGTTGKTLEELDRKAALAKAQQALAPEIAHQLTSIMTDNEARAIDYGLNNPLVLPELGRPAAAKTGTTSDYRDTWTMGYTTDLAVGVWVGNSNNAQMSGLLGAAGPAPIWHNFMVEVHQRPELARHLLDPDGQPYPTGFARPEGIVEAEVCVATGKKPNTPGLPTRKDVFVKGREPSQPCDELTPEENDELAIALRSTVRDAAKFAPGGIQSVQDYRKAVKDFRPPGGVEPGQTPTAGPGPPPTPTPPPRR